MEKEFIEENDYFVRNFKEEISDLKDLAEGVKISGTKNYEEVIDKIIETLDGFADALEEIQGDLYEDSEIEMECPHCGEIVAIDLNDIYDEEIDLLCPHCDKVIDKEDIYEGDEIEMECPNCKELIGIDVDDLYDDNLEIVCPYCDKVIDTDGIDLD